MIHTERNGVEQIALESGAVDVLYKEDPQELFLLRIDSLSRFIDVQQQLRQRELELERQHSQKMSSIGALASGVAHEFNNLLQPILGFSEMMLAQVEPESRDYERLTLVRQSAVRGADLLEKPFDLAVGRALLQRLRETLERQQRLSSRIALLSLDCETLPPLVTESGAMQQSRKIAEVLSAQDEPLLFYGESGSGRTTLARWSYRWSGAEKPLLKVHASSWSAEEMEQLLEASGRGSGLLLQQVERLSEAELQRILLFQKEQGGVLLATANHREEEPLPLYLYHLFPGMVPLPTLQQREQDLLPLLQQWMEESVVRWGCLEPSHDLESLKQKMLQQSWPGNMEQLRQHFTQWLLVQGIDGASTLPLFQEQKSLEGDVSGLSEYATLAELEGVWIEQTLKRCGGNRTRAAESLGINPSTLFRKLKELPNK